MTFPTLPPLSLLNDSVVLVRRVKSGTDAYGNDTFTDTEVPLKGVSVQPVSSTEAFTAQQDIVTDRWILYGPPGMGLSAADHVRWNGLDLEVDGTPMEWTQLVAHTECRLVRWAG